MIRIETENDWLLVGHQAHAALAGEFARHWKNKDFLPAEPFAHVLDAVARHDDSWTERDANPVLTAEHEPSAFTVELVGSYDAFEEIDLQDYLNVRAQATEEAATRDAYAAILISMHTVNLLTEQADLSTLTDEQSKIHSKFIDGQLRKQEELKAQLAQQPDMEKFIHYDYLQRGFEFLQACDSFSLFACVGFQKNSFLRHTHPLRNGTMSKIAFLPIGTNTYRLDPYPLDEPLVTFEVAFKKVSKSSTTDLATFQEAYRQAPLESVTITVQQ